VARALSGVYNKSQASKGMAETGFVMKNAVPKPGDFVVNYRGREDFVIERRTIDNKWEQVAVEKDRLAALQRARILARDAGTRAWTYELDNQFIEMSLG
jgi:hypothetical protein